MWCRVSIEGRKEEGIVGLLDWVLLEGSLGRAEVIVFIMGSVILFRFVF